MTLKRTDNLHSLIPMYDNLCSAFRKAAKGKQTRPEVIAYRENFDAEIRKLQGELIRHEPDIGHYRFFQVFDPKRRSICAASFPERVLHHAIMNICEPVLESYAIYDSYACRKGKGNRKALARAQKFARLYPWYLKMDIKKYFDSIDHTIMMKALSGRFQDEDLLRLFCQLLETYHKKPGKGMPIGNLISQHLANFYLGVFDHWIKEKQRIRGYLRYMDDFIAFGPDKATLKEHLLRIKRFLKEELALELNDNIQLNRSARGIPFLGFRVFPYKIRLSPRSSRRFVKKFREYEDRCLRGEWSEADLTRHMEPLFEFARAADSYGFRRDVIKKYGNDFE